MISQVTGFKGSASIVLVAASPSVITFWYRTAAMSLDAKVPAMADEKVETMNDTRGATIDPEAEKKLLRKCDIRVLPPLFVLFLLAFLDRTNIGMLDTVMIYCPGL
jgi:hypothetical protein